MKILEASVNGVQLVTSSFVWIESISLIHYRLKFEAVLEFENAFRGVKTVWFDEGLYRVALDIFKNQQGKISIADSSLLAISKGTKCDFICFDDYLNKLAKELQYA